MNKEGMAYCQKMHKLSRGTGFKYPTEEKIMERVMRLGGEARAYEAETPGFGSFVITDDLRKLAVATLQEDYLKFSNNT